jgi:hypothetical protein
MADAFDSTPEERAQKRVKDFSDLMWHVAVYVIVNAFLWIMDFAQGGGLEWAYWATIPWGIGLAFHAAAYFLDESGMRSKRYQKYLEEERKADQP